jgi:hypothetical protein
MTTVSLDIPELSRQFENDGYLLLRNVLSEERIAELNSAVDGILSNEQESLSYNIYNSVERAPSILSLKWTIRQFFH